MLITEGRTFLQHLSWHLPLWRLGSLRMWLWWGRAEERRISFIFWFLSIYFFSVLRHFYRDFSESMGCTSSCLGFKPPKTIRERNFFLIVFFFVAVVSYVWWRYYWNKLRFYVFLDYYFLLLKLGLLWTSWYINTEQKDNSNSLDKNKPSVIAIWNQ